MSSQLSSTSALHSSASEASVPEQAPLEASSIAQALGIGLLLIFTAATILCGWLMLQPGWYISSGNLHDLFLPLNSALASLQGLELHKDFHTPFGWIYAELNRLAWTFIVGHKHLSINDIIVVGSLFWTCLVVTAFAISMLAAPAAHRPRWIQAWLLGLLIALLSFNFRGLSSFSIQDTTWYGTYNGQLWALLTLQLVSAFISADGTPTTRLVLVSAITQAFCVSMAVHYKASFGLASVVVAAAPLFKTAPNSKWLSSYLSVLTLFCISFVLVATPKGYSYELYLRDIQSALLAKSELPSQDSYVFTAFMALMLWATLVVLLRIRKTQENSCLIEGENRIQLSEITFFGAISCGVILAILGDFSKPFYMAYVSMALFVISHRFETSRHNWQRITAITFICMVLIANLWSNLRIAKHKDAYINATRYEQVTIPTEYGNLKWKIPKASAYDSITKIFAIDKIPNKLEILLNIAFPESNDRYAYHVPFQNGDYVKSLRLMREHVRELMRSPKDKVLMLAFENPLPLLVGARLPIGSHHWIHFGTSLPMFERDNELFTEFRSADIIALPATSIDIQSQILLNCKFFNWNLSHGHPFKLVSYDKYNLYYTQSPDAIDISTGGNEISARCWERIEEFRLGKALPR